MDTEVVRYALFTLFFTLTLLSIVVSLLLGPAKSFAGSALQFLKDDDIELDEKKERRLRRPNRDDLGDAQKRGPALERYRARAAEAVKRSKETLLLLMSSGFRRVGRVLVVTVVASTAAFVIFLAANGLLFGSQPAKLELSVPPATLLRILGNHLSAAAGFNLLGQCGSPSETLAALWGAETASQVYRLVLVWTVPVLTTQLRGVLYDLPKKWLDATGDLRRIASSSDRELMLDLAEYVGVQVAAVSWVSSLRAKNTCPGSGVVLAA